MALPRVFSFSPLLKGVPPATLSQLARVVPGALPMVKAPAADLASIFELLLSLAWEFSMRDMAAGRLRLDEPSKAELDRCRKLVESRDGKLWTDDGEELGTSLRFTVPS